jgi:hypothetical protein
LERTRRVGMAWYSREDYPALRAVMADGEKLPEAYDLWRLSAEQVEGEVVRSGVEVVRVPLGAEPFRNWCARHDLPLSGAARSRYANEMAAENAAGESEG